MHDFVGDFVVGFEQHFDFGVVFVFARFALGFLGEVHGGQIVVGFEEFFECVPHESGFLLEAAEFLAVDEEVPELVAVDVFFEIPEHFYDGLADAFEFFLEGEGHGYEDGFEGAEFVGEGAVCGRFFLAQFEIEIVHED